MAEETGIQWTKHTWSPWWGCTKISPGCANCYAEALSLRWRSRGYLKDVPRTDMSDQHWRQPLTWDRKARKAEEKSPIFPSMCDPFDGEAPIEWFVRFLGLISRTPNLVWQLLTKRPEQVMDRLVAANKLLAPLAGPWLDGKAPANVHLGVSVENQEYAEKRIPALLGLPAALRFVSVEPLLGPVSLTDLTCEGAMLLDALRGEPKVDWVIVGGESGEGESIRGCEVAYIRGLIWQCQAAAVPVFVKQLGSLPTNGYDLSAPLDGPLTLKLVDNKGGSPSEWPADLNIRELPGGFNAGTFAERVS